MTDVPIAADALLAGRYRLREPLGHGGMATVYRATDERLGRDVAVKVFRRDVAEAVDVQRIQREMRLLAGVQSPYVVTVFDAVDSDVPGLAYLVLELVEGSDLRTLLDRPRRPSAEFVRRIVADVAMGLEALHGQGVVHRDVKPANVLVLAGANRRPNSVAAKLSDFGIAQSVDSTRLTATNFILGTAAYLSPEQVRGAKLRPASDVYSLGLMLIESLTGKPAFPGPVAESAAARLARPPQLPRNASPALADLLSRMTAVDPGERPRAGEVATALHELAGAMTTTRASTAATVAVPTAAAMPLGHAAADEGEPTALAERPRRRRTNTAPVALAAGAAAVAAAEGATAQGAAAAEGSTAPRPSPPQDREPTAQTPVAAASPADGPETEDGIDFLQHELPIAPVTMPTGEHHVGALRRHPRATMLATLAGCALIVGAGSVALASTGGPFFAGADIRTEAPVAALANPPGAGAGTSSQMRQSQIEAQRRTEDLITTLGAREAGIADRPPLKPVATPKPKPKATTATTTRSSSSSTPTRSSTPTHSSTPTPTPTKTATPTPTPTPTPTKTTDTPTPTPTTSTPTTEPSPTGSPTTEPPTPTDTPTASTPSSTSSSGSGDKTGGATSGSGSSGTGSGDDR